MKKHLPLINEKAAAQRTAEKKPTTPKREDLASRPAISILSRGYSSERLSESGPGPVQAIQERKLEHRPPVQRVAASQTSTVRTAEASQGPTGLGGLPAPLKESVEQLSGLSLADVRVHYHSTQPATVQARAFTRGSEIHLAHGEERNLPHEAWHVVQQKQNRVAGTKYLQGVPLNDNPGLEAEADQMGAKAHQLSLQRKATDPGADSASAEKARGKRLVRVPNRAGQAVQRKILFRKPAVSEDPRAKPILSEPTVQEIVSELSRVGLLARARTLFGDVLATKPDAIRQSPKLAGFDPGKLATLAGLIKAWKEHDDSRNFEYGTSESDLLKLLKDVFKYFLHSQLGWRSVGVAEYMTGDATGLALAPLVDPKMTIKVLAGKKKRAEDGHGPTFLSPPGGNLPDYFREAVRQGNVVLSDTGPKAAYKGTAERYLRRYNKVIEDKRTPIKPWNFETYAATDAIGKGFHDPSSQARLRQEMLPQSKDQALKDEIKDFKRDAVDPQLDGKSCILLWGRFSGAKGGAHKELDSHPLMMIQLAHMIQQRFPSRILVIIGDPVITTSDLVRNGITNPIVFLGPFWEKNPVFKNNRNAQRYFLKLLSDQNQAISIGMRSGSLEGMALLNMKVIFLDDKDNAAAGRMEFWSGSAADQRAETMGRSKAEKQQSLIGDLMQAQQLLQMALVQRSDVRKRLMLLKLANIHLRFALLDLKIGMARKHLTHFSELLHQGPMKNYKRVATLQLLGDETDKREALLRQFDELLVHLLGAHDRQGFPVCTETGNDQGRALLEPLLSVPVMEGLLRGLMPAKPADLKAFYQHFAQAFGTLGKGDYGGTQIAGVRSNFTFNRGELGRILQRLGTLEESPAILIAKANLNDLLGRQDDTGHPLANDEETSKAAKPLLANLLKESEPSAKDLHAFNENFGKRAPGFRGKAPSYQVVKLKKAAVIEILRAIEVLKKNNILQENELDQIEFLIHHLSQ